jgi:hypothetical protein
MAHLSLSQSMLERVLELAVAWEHESPQIFHVIFSLLQTDVNILLYFVQLTYCDFVIALVES